MAEKISVLLVEDEMPVAEDIGEQLKRIGYQVAGIAVSSAEALRLVAQKQPDLILMDINLKGKTNGIETAAKIKRKYDLPVIYLTAYADQETLANVKKTEPYGFITKPFNTRELQGVLETAFYKWQIEHKLKENEKNLRIMLDSIGDAVIATDTQGHISRMNPMAEKLTGWQSSQALGKPFDQVVTLYREGTARLVSNPVQAVLEIGRIRGLSNHTTLINREGTKHRIADSGAPIFDDQGELQGVIMVLRDETERYRMETELRESEEELRTIYQNAPFIMVLVDINRRIRKANAQAAAFADSNPDAMLGLRGGEALRCLHHLDDPRGCGFGPFCDQCKIRNAVLDTFETKENHFQLETTLPIQKQGQQQEIILLVSTGLLHHKAEPLVLVTLQDITQRKQAEEALRDSEARFRRLAENAQDLIYRIRLVPDRAFEYVSPVATSMTGYTPEEHYADPDLGFKMVHPDDRHLLKNLATGEKAEQKQLTLRWVRKDGSVIWTEQCNVPIYDKAGKLVAIEGIVRDVTDRVQAEKERQASADKYRAIVESAYNAMVICRKTKFVFFNQAFARLTGYSRSELVDIDIGRLFKGEDARLFQLQARKDPVYRELQLKRKSGRLLEIEITATPIDFQGQAALLLMIRDITQQKALLQELQQSSGQTKKLGNFIPICAACKKIRDDQQDGHPWVIPEEYIQSRLPDIQFSHGICSECMPKLYPDYFRKPSDQKTQQGKEKKKK